VVGGIDSVCALLLSGADAVAVFEIDAQVFDRFAREFVVDAVKDVFRERRESAAVFVEGAEGDV